MGRTLLVDFDCTVADTYSSVLELIAFRHGIKVAKQEIKSYDLTKNPKLNGFTYGRLTRMFAEVLEMDMVHLEDPRIPSIISRLGRHYRMFMTTVSPASKEELYRFTYLNRVPMDYIASFSDSLAKARIDADAIIDDNYDNVAACANAGMHAVLLRQPWNEGTVMHAQHTNMHFANDWIDAERILMGLLRLPPRTNGNPNGR